MGVDNVLLLGAGASKAAGIPLLSEFVQEMSTLAQKGICHGKTIPPAEREIIREADRIRSGLDNYHARASFDSYNIEDLLSILAFERNSSRQKSENYDKLVKAISVAIELSCNLESLASDAVPPSGITNDNAYGVFWHYLFRHHRNKFPAILTFNYDLVLERSLWNFCHQFEGADTEHAIPREIVVDYHYPRPFSLKVESQMIHVPDNVRRTSGGNVALKTGIRPQFSEVSNEAFRIHYFKLHGSLNWSTSNDLNSSPLKAEVSPFILPPVFNKMNAPKIDPVWNDALELLRNAKNIIIVGYSLPRTDIYMQYFLKAAIGPNTNLNHVYVFDPVLKSDSEASRQMKLRYSECFSPEFQRRIMFSPPEIQIQSGPKRTPIPDDWRGTFKHFAHCLQTPATELFF